MSIDDLERPHRYVFSEGVTASERAEVERRLRDMRPDMPVFTESTRLVKRLRPKIAAQCRSMLDLGVDLDLDLRECVPRAEDFYIYDAVDGTHLRASRKWAPTTVATSYFNGYTSPYAVVVGDDKLRLLTTTNHELVHMTAYKRRLDIMEDGTLRDVHGTGFMQGAHGSALDEALTELINLQLIRDYWPQTPRLLRVGFHSEKLFRVTGYRHAVLLLNEILKHADSPTDAFAELQRGLFRGDSTSLEVIEDIIGTANLREFLAIENADSRNAPQQLAYRLGFRAVEKALRRDIVWHDDFRECGVLEWLPRPSLVTTMRKRMTAGFRSDS